MRVTLSIPDALFTTGESVSKRLGVSRSRLYATALAEFVAKQNDRKTTELLDAVYATEQGGLDPAIRRIQKRSLATESW